MPLDQMPGEFVGVRGRGIVCANLFVLCLSTRWHNARYQARFATADEEKS